MCGCGGIYRCALVVITLISVCRAQNCDDAKNCLQQLQDLSTSETCQERLYSMSKLKVCIDDNKNDCGASDLSEINKDQDLVLAPFAESCSEGCVGVIEKASGIYKNCIKSTNVFESLLDSVRVTWNYNREPDADVDLFREAIGCIKDSLEGCSMLQKYYGTLYQQYPELPMLEQAYNKDNGNDKDKIYDEPNSQSPRAPIITDCDMIVKDKVEAISKECAIDQDKLYAADHIITNFCVPMQDQIDCVMKYQKTCPVAVTQYLLPFMDSYGVTHNVFCSNISINNVHLRSIESCTRKEYRSIYKACWEPLIKKFATDGNTHEELDGHALDAIFVWAFLEESGAFCDVFKDPTSYNPNKLRGCLRDYNQKCTIPMPTHGRSRVSAPEGNLYNPELYDILKSGMTGFNVYGVLLIQYQRDQLCYKDCKDYDEDNEDYIKDCQNEVRTLAGTVSNSADSKDVCKEFKNLIKCTEKYSKSCPLFQYQAGNLLEEQDVMAALTKCELDKPNLLPDDYYYKTTTFAPFSTTSYWNTTSITDTANSPAITRTLAMLTILTTLYLPSFY